MKVIAGILGLIALLALRSALQDGFRNVLISAATNKANSCLTMAGNTTSVEDGYTFIIGNIKNNCNRPFGMVTIVFKLDRRRGPTENLPEGIAYAYSRDVEPNETRRFKTAIPISKDSTYRFDRITSY